MKRLDDFEIDEANARCRAHRRRILDISQQVAALHVGSAFSCIEMLDFAYHHIIRPNVDNFILSKGHAAIAVYVILEEMGIIQATDLDKFAQPGGTLSTHPDRGTPGIIASTGSLGHGLAMGIGMAQAERARGSGAKTLVLISDGELFEGSTWEAILQAGALRLEDLILFIDNNDWISNSRISETHRVLYPIGAKLAGFGWETFDVAGHKVEAFRLALKWRRQHKPCALICDTVKGFGCSFMVDNPIWAYRSPNPEEYQQAIREIG